VEVQSTYHTDSEAVASSSKKYGNSSANKAKNLATAISTEKEVGAETVESTARIDIISVVLA